MVPSHVPFHACRKKTPNSIVPSSLSLLSIDADRMTFVFSRSSTVDAAAVPPSHAQSRREPAAARAPAGEAALASPGVPLPRPAPAVANPFRDGHPGAFPRFRCDAGTAPPPWQGTGGVTGGGRPVQVPGGGCPKIHAAMRPAADSSAAPSDPDPDAMEVEATEAEEAP